MIPQDCFDKVKDYFNGDLKKTWRWFLTINSALGGVTPLEMIKRGNALKLKKFIDSRLEGFFP
jgi:hypothetical protein